jgi:hypothetical protein
VDCVRTLKRGTRAGVRAIHGMRSQEHVVDYPINAGGERYVFNDSDG